MSYVSGLNNKLVVCGAGEYGKRVLEKLERFVGGDNVYVADSKAAGTCGGHKIMPYCEIDSMSTCIIAMANKKDATDVYFELKNQNVTDIYYYLGKTRCFGNDFLMDECISCNERLDKNLLYAEIHVVDFCNLNCRGCTHYSPIFMKKYPEITDWKKDLDDLKTVYEDIPIINLLGGEPFLNPQIDQMIVYARQKYHDAHIRVSSNGVLIPQIDKRVLECLKENDCTVQITEYAPTHRLIGKILHRLEEYELDYVLIPFEKKQLFNKPLVLRNVNERKHLCISRGCVNIWKGKIAGCPTLMYICELNKRFSVAFPTDGVYSIKCGKSGKELRSILYESKPLCRHCVANPIPWSTCKGEPQLEDFSDE